MKITGSRSIRSGAARRAAAKTGSGGAAFRIEDVDAVEAAGQTGATASVAGVGALLALQEVPDATEQRRRAVRRSEDLLDELSQLRLGLLSGNLPRQRLRRLMDLLRERPDGYADPRLDGMIAEIELRTAVELAKIEVMESKRR